MTIKLMRLALAYSLDEIRSFPKENHRDYEVVLLPARDRWLYVPDVYNEDDGVDWLLPSWKSAEESGRWARWDAGSGSGSVTLPIAESDVTNLVSDLAALAAADANEAVARSMGDAGAVAMVANEASQRVAGDKPENADQILANQIFGG